MAQEMLGFLECAGWAPFNPPLRMHSTDKPIQLLVVMDPIAAIKPGKDSTLAMLLEAQRRGWAIWYAELGDLSLRDGEARGHLRELRVTDDPDDWFELGDASETPLGQMGVILMRKDPPFTMEYVYATYILDQAEARGALVVNRPQSLRDANEKAAVAWFPECSVPSLVSRSLRQLREFIDEYGRAVIKPLDRMAGHSVFVTGARDPNRNVVLETLTKLGTRYVMAQMYVPDIVESGDKRILLIDGEPVPDVLVRIPSADDHRGNISAGASTECRRLVDADRHICDRIGPVLRERGLLFVGIDVIGEYLTEINVTSPTGIRELDHACGLNIAGDMMNAIESRIEKRARLT